MEFLLFVLAADNLICLSCTFICFFICPTPPKHPAPRSCTLVRKQVNRFAAKLAWLEIAKSPCFIDFPF